MWSLFLVSALGAGAVTEPAYTTLNNTDWPTRVSDDPVLHTTQTLEECVLMCKLRNDCVAVSWAGPETPTKEDLHTCSFKCAALPDQLVPTTGHFGVIVRPGTTVCPPASWYPKDWQADIDSGSLLLAGPKQEGAHIGNGYVATWIKSLVGSQGPVQAGVEHIAGVVAGAPTNTSKITNAGCVSWCDRAHKADIPSITATTTIATLGGEEQHATASAMDLRRSSYLRASRTKNGKASCVQTTYAHRVHKHILVTEYRCDNEAVDAVTVVLAQPQPSPIATPTAELTNESFSSNIPGVSCTKMRVKLSEADGVTRPLIAECHSNCDGAEFSIPPGAKGHYHACISARHTSVDGYGAVTWPPQPGDDADPEGTNCDPVPLALASWAAANASAPTLLASHVAAMAELQRGGIEVEGDIHLVRIINSSMSSMLNTYRADVTFGGSASGGLETDAYAGGTGGGWDIETWQFPWLLTFYPDMAQSVLQYRVDRQQAAAENARKIRGRPSSTLDYNVSFEGLMYPWMGAFSGAENNPGHPFFGELADVSTVWPTEDHINGDISLAFQQYWMATHNVTWLRDQGFSVIEGIAQFWVSKAVKNVDGSYSISQTQSPDEYHTNITDSVYNNAIARISLLGAHTLADAAGKSSNETFAKVGQGLRILYDKQKDFHPEYRGFNDSSVIKQADVVLLDYPLQVKPETNETRRNDLLLYAKLTDPVGPAMTWMIHSIAFGDIGDDEQAAAYFHKSTAKYVRSPFFVWHEGANMAGGAPNFINGAGMYLLNVVAGYGGVRLNLETQELLLKRPRPPPNCTKLILRRVYFRGAFLNLEATDSMWSVALDEPAPSGVTLQLVSDTTDVGNVTLVYTNGAVANPPGSSAMVVQLETDRR